MLLRSILFLLLLGLSATVGQEQLPGDVYKGLADLRDIATPMVPLDIQQQDEIERNQSYTHQRVQKEICGGSALVSWRCQRKCHEQEPFPDLESAKRFGTCKVPEPGLMCLGTPITYQYVQHDWELKFPAELEVLRFMPGCWSELAPLLCISFYRPCALHKIYQEADSLRPNGSHTHIEFLYQLRRGYCRSALKHCSEALPYLPSWVDCGSDVVHDKEKTMLESNTTAENATVVIASTMPRSFAIAPGFFSDDCLMPAIPLSFRNGECPFPLVYRFNRIDFPDHVQPVFDSCFIPCRSPQVYRHDRLQQVNNQLGFGIIMVAMSLCVSVYLWFVSFIYEKSVCVFAMTQSILCISVYYSVWVFGSLPYFADIAECTSDGLRFPAHLHMTVDWCALQSFTLHASFTAAFVWLVVLFIFNVLQPPISYNEKMPHANLRLSTAMFVYIPTIIYCYAIMMSYIRESDGISGVCHVGMLNSISYSIAVVAPLLLVMIPTSAYSIYMYRVKYTDLKNDCLGVNKTISRCEDWHRTRKYVYLKNHMFREDPAHVITFEELVAADMRDVENWEIATGRVIPENPFPEEPDQEFTKENGFYQRKKSWMKPKAVELYQGTNPMGPEMAQSRQLMENSEVLGEAGAIAYATNMLEAFRPMRERFIYSIWHRWTVAAMGMAIFALIASIIIHPIMLHTWQTSEHDNIVDYVRCGMSGVVRNRSRDWIFDELNRNNTANGRIGAHAFEPCQLKPFMPSQRHNGVIIVFLILPALPFMVLFAAFLVGCGQMGGMKKVGEKRTEHCFNLKWLKGCGWKNDRSCEEGTELEELNKVELGDIDIEKQRVPKDGSLVERWLTDTETHTTERNVQSTSSNSEWRKAAKKHLRIKEKKFIPGADLCVISERDEDDEEDTASLITQPGDGSSQFSRRNRERLPMQPSSASVSQSEPDRQPTNRVRFANGSPDATRRASSSAEPPRERGPSPIGGPSTSRETPEQRQTIDALRVLNGIRQNEKTIQRVSSDLDIPKKQLNEIVMHIAELLHRSQREGELIERHRHLAVNMLEVHARGNYNADMMANNRVAWQVIWPLLEEVVNTLTLVFPPDEQPPDGDMEEVTRRLFNMLIQIRQAVEGIRPHIDFMPSWEQSSLEMNQMLRRMIDEMGMLNRPRSQSPSASSGIATGSDTPSGSGAASLPRRSPQQPQPARGQLSRRPTSAPAGGRAAVDAEQAPANARVEVVNEENQQAAAAVAPRRVINAPPLFGNPNQQNRAANGNNQPGPFAGIVFGPPPANAGVPAAAPVQAAPLVQPAPVGHDRRAVAPNPAAAPANAAPVGRAAAAAAVPAQPVNPVVAAVPVAQPLVNGVPPQPAAEPAAGNPHLEVVGLDHNIGLANPADSSDDEEEVNPPLPADNAIAATSNIVSGYTESYSAAPQGFYTRMTADEIRLRAGRMRDSYHQQMYPHDFIFIFILMGDIRLAGNGPRNENEYLVRVGTETNMYRNLFGDVPTIDVSYDPAQFLVWMRRRALYFVGSIGFSYQRMQRERPGTTFNPPILPGFGLELMEQELTLGSILGHGSLSAIRELLNHFNGGINPIVYSPHLPLVYNFTLYLDEFCTNAGQPPLHRIEFIPDPEPPSPTKSRREPGPSTSKEQGPSTSKQQSSSSQQPTVPNEADEDSDSIDTISEVSYDSVAEESDGDDADEDGPPPGAAHQQAITAR